MEQYRVEKITKQVAGRVEVPGSKSITNRALFLAAMANGKSVLRNVLFSDDSRSFLECLEKLGYSLDINEQAKIVQIEGGIPCKEAAINVRSAGTSARFLTALLAFSSGEYEVHASRQMCKRPMKPLCEALETLGCGIAYQGEEYFLPFRISGTHCKGGNIELFAEQSSQFLSALLMTGHLCENGLNIKHVGKEIAKPYIDMTIKMINQFGGKVQKSGQTYFAAPSDPYKAMDYLVEPDVSGASYFFAIAVLLGGEILVENVHLDSLQGDIQFLDVLKKLGAEVEDRAEGILVKGPEDGCYNGIEVDLNHCSDQTMTLAVLAIFAKTPTIIHGINHIRLQESDRIHAIKSELKKLGIECKDIEDGIIIYPGVPKPAVIDTYEDHRMAMAFSLVGLKVDGIIIDNPKCVEKTFENFFETLENINLQGWKE